MTLHGLLHYLPFELLLTAPLAPGTQRFGALPYLIQSAAVLYAPSASSLAHLRASVAATDYASDHADAHTADQPTTEYLLLGDPVGGGEGSAGAASVYAATRSHPSALPFARGELHRIATLFPDERTRVLRGAEATPAALCTAGERARYRLVHFAAHGVFNERRPRFSGLLLSQDPDSGDDGFLSVGAVFGLRLQSELIVLAACSSALGERVTGEGLVGLTRAFLYAGAHNVIAALWEVSDAATADFMTDMYRRLAADGGRSPAQALAAAKRRFIAGGPVATEAESPPAAGGARLDRAHPFCWAAFVLTGAGR